MDDKIKKKPNWRQKADSLGMNYQLLSEEEAQKLLIMENRQFRDEIKELKAVNKQLKQSLKYATDPNSGLYDEVVESNEYLEDKIKELKDELAKEKGLRDH